jgi:hypothetical protein
MPPVTEFKGGCLLPLWAGMEGLASAETSTAAVVWELLGSSWMSVAFAMWMDGIGGEADISLSIAPYVMWVTSIVDWTTEMESETGAFTGVPIVSCVLSVLSAWTESIWFSSRALGPDDVGFPATIGPIPPAPSSFGRLPWRWWEIQRFPITEIVEFAEWIPWETEQFLLVFDEPGRDGRDKELPIADDFSDKLDSQGLLVLKDRERATWWRETKRNAWTSQFLQAPVLARTIAMRVQIKPLVSRDMV